MLTKIKRELRDFYRIMKIETILIESITDLERLRHLHPRRQYVVKFGVDLDFSDYGTMISQANGVDGKEVQSEETLKPFLKTQQRKGTFEPIDLSHFEGTMIIKGDDHVIRSLQIDDDSRKNVGLISRISPKASITIQKLHFEDPVIHGAENVGCFVGSGDVSFFQCLVAGGNISGCKNVGAFTGACTNFDARECSASTTITAEEMAGSLVGTVEKEATIINCCSTSFVTTRENSEHKLCGSVAELTQIKSITTVLDDKDIKIYKKEMN